MSILYKNIGIEGVGQYGGLKEGGYIYIYIDIDIPIYKYTIYIIYITIHI